MLVNHLVGGRQPAANPVQRLAERLAAPSRTDPAVRRKTGQHDRVEPRVGLHVDVAAASRADRPQRVGRSRVVASLITDLKARL
jgi:hypothetical protein